MGHVRRVGAALLVSIPCLANAETDTGPNPEPIYMEGQPVVMQWRMTTTGCRIFAPSIFHPRNGKRLDVVWGGKCIGGYASGDGHRVESMYGSVRIDSEFITYAAVPFKKGVAHVGPEYFKKHHLVNVFEALSIHSIECGDEGKILASFRVKRGHVAHANGAFEIYGMALILEKWSRQNCPSVDLKIPVETILYNVPFESRDYKLYMHSFRASDHNHRMHFIRSTDYGWNISYNWRLALDLF